MNESATATRQQLEELWHLLLAFLIEELSKPREAITPEMLNVTRQFLRDAGVISDVGAMLDASTTLQRMQELTLPFSRKGNR